MQESKGGRHWWGVMEGGGAHLGSLLPMSAFIRRRSFSCAGSRLHSQAPFSFVGVIFVHGRSPSLVGGGLRRRSWAFTFVRGRSPLFMGGRAVGVIVPFVWCRGRSSSSQAVVPLVGCSGGELVGCGGGGKLVCGGGELVGCGSRPLVCGGGRSSWPFVVV